MLPRGTPMVNKFVLIEDDLNERRETSDRRVDFTATTFPIFTKQGTWVRKECRKTPERRIENLNVTETQLDAQEFKELFKEYTE